MADSVDWGVAGWEGHRRRQHQEFRALTFREKLEIIDQLGEVSAFFTERRRARGLPVRSFPPPPARDGRADAPHS